MMFAPNCRVPLKKTGVADDLKKIGDRPWNFC